MWTRGVVVCGCLLLAGCTGSDSAGSERTDLDAGDKSACEGFFDDLPQTLIGERRVGLDADQLSAAYGSPAIVVQCGVDVPEEFDATAQCEVAEHVGWYAPVEQYDDQDADVTLFSVTYRPIVEVRLPGEYRPDGIAAALADLADPVKDNLTKDKNCL
jgi:Protein of unknown function (DUF3515)